MSTKKFYYPDGSEIMNPEEFIHFYSGVYSYQNRDLRLEQTIEEILKKDDLVAENIVDILRWKIGAIGFSYQDNIVTNQWYSIDTGKLIEEIKGTKKISEPVCNTIGALMKHERIGPVYAITLLYFLSKGDYPIYDRFAHIAIKAICEEKTFESLVTDKELRKEFNPDIRNAEKVFECYKMHYMDRLYNVFDRRAYKESRNIDRALWAYGHLFSETQSNQQRVLPAKD